MIEARRPCVCGSDCQLSSAIDTALNFGQAGFDALLNSPSYEQCNFYNALREWMMSDRSVPRPDIQTSEQAEIEEQTLKEETAEEKSLSKTQDKSVDHTSVSPTAIVLVPTQRPFAPMATQPTKETRYLGVAAKPDSGRIKKKKIVEDVDLESYMDDRSKEVKAAIPENLEKLNSSPIHQLVDVESIVIDWLTDSGAKLLANAWIKTELPIAKFFNFFDELIMIRGEYPYNRKVLEQRNELAELDARLADVYKRYAITGGLKKEVYRPFHLLLCLITKKWLKTL